MRFITVLATALAIVPVVAQPPSSEAIAGSLLARRYLPYPEAAEGAGIEGTVLVEFTVDRLCNISNKRVVRGLGYGLDEAALNVIDRKFEDALMEALAPCSPDTLVVPVRFELR